MNNAEYKCRFLSCLKTKLNVGPTDHHHHDEEDEDTT